MGEKTEQLPFCFGRSKASTGDSLKTCKSANLIASFSASKKKSTKIARSSQDSPRSNLSASLHVLLRRVYCFMAVSILI